LNKAIKTLIFFNKIFCLRIILTLNYIQMKNYIISGVISLCVSIGVVWLAPEFIPGVKTVKIEHIERKALPGALFTYDENKGIVPLDFTAVAADVMDAVVHIKSTQTSTARQNQQYRRLPDPFRDFFGDDFEHFFGPGQRFDSRSQPRVGTGSGVIINSEGYIVTNNHVITDADDIEVTLHDNRSYKATVIGTDPSTDLALIQIKEKDLKSLPMINSDDVKVGEWVLAVGNPFNLNSTVTAGIVSAKSRNINILQDQYAIEAFIQTDAAINPGNSGGALINMKGGLIGINTAIASPTGTYAGYGFAIPSNLVNKVVEDLLKYGAVQRGYLGVTIRKVDGNLAKEKKLKVNSGVYVDSVTVNSAALDAGIKSGDVILEVNKSRVSTVPELQELIARHRPGDEVEVKVNRDGKEKNIKVKLKTRDGESQYTATNRKEALNLLGADFEEIDRSTAKKLEISGGVKVKKLFLGKLKKETQIKEGFIITKVEGKVIKSQEDLVKVLENKKGGILIEGIYEDVPGVHYYAIGL
jgi:serine protease Do